jgi:hypothetical protein
MTRAYPGTPLWVELTIAALLTTAVAWWIADRQDRVANERRLSAIASQIAGREVRVECPGPLGRLFGWDIVEGSVRFGPDGRPADETKIRRQSCAELDALAEGRRDNELECIGRAPGGGRCVWIRCSGGGEGALRRWQVLGDGDGRNAAVDRDLLGTDVMLAGDGLHPSSAGARVIFTGSERKVIDGPFAETKELLAGYWLWQVKSLDEAIDWVKRVPDPMPGTEAIIEIRPVFEAEDFGEELTPELRAKAQELRQQVEAGQ